MHEQQSGRGGAVGRLLHRRGGHDAERGGALVMVVGAISVLTAFALVALLAAMTAAPLSRRAQDARSATAAAQAGIDDYLAHLVANPTYYTSGVSGVDAGNPAFGTGAPVPASAGSTFTYQLLTTPAQTVQDGVIRLRATGTTDGTSRSLTATMSQAGFLDYIYFSDLEVRDPALVTMREVNATVVGVSGTYSPDTKAYAERCGTYYYAGRHATGSLTSSSAEYTSSAEMPYYVRDAEGLTASTDYGRTVRFSCGEISFGYGDVIDGPLHTNDAMRIASGGLTFKSPVTESSWPDGGTFPPRAASRWWGDGSPSSGSFKPVYAPPLQLPGSNGDLRARVLSAGREAGCTYTGETRIVFDGAQMRVLSPQTTVSTPGCFDASTGTRETEQVISPVPPLVYVDDLGGTCPSTTSLGYPMAGEAAAGATAIDYACANGTAFVQGKVSGQVTVASARDVVVTGDLTYATGTTGTDVLGLIPNGFAWVYNPQRADGTRLLGTPVGTIQAGILSIGHSFVVQNYDRGGTLGKLTVDGTIAQKYRGIVRRGANGYEKNYRFDKRLANLPPPYFLTPADSPWTVTRVSDG
ncbi:hypothetical protein [uncultured Pseudokineococcus sp.]|uniref:hypothetical protein n=1 Tax=uncultured Pseudokineococcus sp. TaxID=1642928 RepID=UPI0026310159|nr:hypothetical protein [uncultured Pseudokineococcus sp.]